MRWTKDFLQLALPQVEIVSWVEKKITGVNIDSRSVKPGEFFVALRGKACDGHDFIDESIKQGATGILLEKNRLDCLKKVDVAELTVLAVDDTRQALIDLATAWRAQFSIPVVAITGSVGKTTTKEILARIIERQGWSYTASKGNLNTLVGAPLSVFSMKEEDQVAIFELGINKRGEMKKLAKLVRPTTAIITYIGHSHMEGLGSVHDISAEKRDVFSTFTESNVGIINGDQPLLSNVSYAHPIIKFGTKTTNQIQARKIKVGPTTTSFTLKLYKEKYPVTLSSIHPGAVPNALAAITAAYRLDIPVATILEVIQEEVIVPGRFEVRQLKARPGVIINDCYNANPESMKAALLAFEKMETVHPKIALLGDMLELGANSPFWHRQLGRFMRKVPSVKKLILVGSMVEWTKKTVPVTLNVEVVPTWKDAQQLLELELKEESIVLVKGSNGIGLGNLVTSIT